MIGTDAASEETGKLVPSEGSMKSDDSQEESYDFILGLHPLCHNRRIEDCLEPSHLAFVATAVANYLRVIDSSSESQEAKNIENRKQLPKMGEMSSLRQQNQGKWSFGMCIAHISEYYKDSVLVAFGNAVSRYGNLRASWHDGEERSEEEHALCAEAIDKLLEHMNRAKQESLEAKTNKPTMPWPRWDEAIWALREWVYSIDVSHPLRDQLISSMLHFVVEAMLKLSNEQWDGRRMYISDFSSEDDEAELSHAPVGFWLDGDSCAPLGMHRRDRMLASDLTDNIRRYVRPSDPDIHGDVKYWKQRAVAEEISRDIRLNAILLERLQDELKKLRC